MKKIKDLYYKYDYWISENQGWGWFLFIVFFFIFSAFVALLMLYISKIFFLTLILVYASTTYQNENIFLKKSGE